MKGFKVVVTLPEGKKSHFVPDLPNNFSGAKAAVDQISRLYAIKHRLVISPTANFFDDGRDYVPPSKDHLPGLPPDQRCWCGWWKLGECPSCPDELSFADNTRSRTSV